MKITQPRARRQSLTTVVNRPVKVASAAIATSPAGRSFPVIAMAASVGSLPAKFSAAVAIVMHLSPDHKSILAEILNRRTHLLVKEARSGDALCPACVLIAPPNHHLFFAQGGRLKRSTSQAKKINYARPLAEPLVVSVASVNRQGAIAVVLTGGDGDGAFGVQIVREKGGKVIAQDRPTSKDFSMPESSINTGDVDFILPLDKVAAKLIQLVGAGRPALAGSGDRQNKSELASPEKIVRPRYAAATKAATLTRRK